VGLELGDGNKIDLVRGGAHRTDPPPGRTINRWMVKLGFDPKEVAAEHDAKGAAPTPAPTPTPEAVSPSPGGKTSDDPRTQVGPAAGRDRSSTGSGGHCSSCTTT